MSIQIINGIQLPAFDVEMLTLGKLIAVPFIQSQKEGKAFWLYPSQKLPLNLSLEQYYQPEYITKAESSLIQYQTHPIHIKAWARCERHWRINPEQKHLLPKIAQSTIWNMNALEHMFEQHKVLKLLILRLYRLSNPCIVNIPPEPGAFYWSKSEDLITTATENDTPVVCEASFHKRKALLLTGKVYRHTEIEALQFQCEQILDNNPDAQQLNYDVKQFLGWTSEPPTQKPDTKLDWINDIAALGDRSIELEEKKSNYQAGTEFENIARRSLEFLGFKVEEDYKGGAGGLDLFCSQPYPLVCECKAGKLIPSGTVQELIKLGGMHLGAGQFLNSTKLVIGPGNPSTDMLKAAKEWKVSIINAMTLQKLVELKAKYPGAINLFELKQYLESGQINYKIDEYIEKVEKKISLRSHLVKLIKNYLENTGLDNAGVDSLHGVYFGSNPPQSLKTEDMHEILIELSSPLTGYLGKIKGSDWKSDRFYFLRDLPTPQI
jgi:hypothetical protein